MKEKTGIKGVYRIHIVDEDGSIASDSGWHTNMVTNLGIQNFLAGAVFGNTGSKQVTHMALGTGTDAIVSTATSLVGEVMSSTARVTVSKAFSSRTASAGSATQYLYGTFNAGFLGTATTLGNIGLFAASDGNDIFAGNTYTPQSCGTNQAVNATYQIQLG